MTMVQTRYSLFTFFLSIIIVMSLAPSTVLADQIVTYTFSNATLSDSGTVTGSFSLDLNTFNYTNNTGEIGTWTVSSATDSSINGAYTFNNFGTTTAAYFKNAQSTAESLQILTNQSTPILTGSIDLQSTAGTIIGGITPAGPVIATFNSGSTLLVSTSTTGVPEPGTVWLMGIGLVGLLGVSRRRRKAAD